MKKYLPAIVLLFLSLSSNIIAQVVTIDLTGGYCVPIAPGTHTVNSTVYEIPVAPNFYTVAGTVKTVSYGKGGNVSLGFNWYSKKNIGFGVKVNAMISSPFSFSTRVVYMTGDVANYDFINKPFCLQFIPHFSFRHEFKVVSPVIEAGMIIGMASIRQSYNATYLSHHVYSTTRDYGGAMLGFYTSAGLAFNVSKVAKIMLAVTCSAGSYSPKKWEVTKYTYDGVDQTRYMPTYRRRGEYVDSQDSQTAQNPNQPGREIKYSAAFSNVGFNAGLSFAIGAKKKKSKKVKEKGPDDIHPF
jgi:hypothetical protein